MQATASITIQKLNDEVLFRIPDPASIADSDEVEFLDVSARKLALVVVPPHSTFEVKHAEGLKVIQGRGTTAPPYEFTLSITDSSSDSPLDRQIRHCPASSSSSSAIQRRQYGSAGSG